MQSLQIDHRIISPASSTFVIAEIGVNHDGSVERALELVSHARNSGADAVKLQIFNARTLMHASTAFASYQADRCNEASAVEMLEGYELSSEELTLVVEAIRKAGMLPIATPFSLEDVERVGQLNLPAIKIASPDLVNRPLLQRAAALNKPLLISTGASTIEEIEQTVKWLVDWKSPFALLHCISAYPTNDADANLCWITELAARFGVIVGYSDHTTEILSGALAVSAGARVIEKHLTYDRSAAGPDHSASFDPAEFKRYVEFIRRAELLSGTLGRRVLNVEQDVRKVSRQSLVLRRAIKIGQRIAETDLTIQRPGTGIPAAEMAKVVGRSAAHPIPAGTLLTWEMLHAA
jgi:N,N'-diacetyllegionaminate synthase